MSPVVLITGCSAGLGLLTAVECARRGARVVATLRNPDRRGLLEEAAKEAGVELDIRLLDVTVPEQREACVAGVIEDHGRIDVLVNNAGYGVFGAFEEIPEGSLRQLFETNFFAVLELTRAVLPHMREAGSGRIINLSSGQGRAGLPGFSVYGSSKFAVEGWSEALAHEVGRLGIRVCCVEPGSTATDFSFDSLERHGDDGPYAGVVGGVDRFIHPIFMSSPKRVARKIAKVSLRRNPPPRVPIGPDVWLLLLAKNLLGLRLLRWVTRVFLPLFARRN